MAPMTILLVQLWPTVFLASPQSYRDSSAVQLMLYQTCCQKRGNPSHRYIYIIWVFYRSQPLERMCLQQQQRCRQPGHCSGGAVSYESIYLGSPSDGDPSSKTGPCSQERRRQPGQRGPCSAPGNL